MLIVGLGNPGQKYADTRHNIGFMGVDVVAKAMRCSFNKTICQAYVAAFSFKGNSHLLAKPQTYMNLSGESVGPLLTNQNLVPSDLIVIVDDINLPLGCLRLRPSGGAGGHHGLESIIYFIGEGFWRLRIGIGREQPPQSEAYNLQLKDNNLNVANKPLRNDTNMVNFVLGALDLCEQEVLQKIFQEIPDLIRMIIAGFGIKAMGKYNGRKYISECLLQRVTVRE